ncbi:microfibril-associated glycoprotein 4-like [Montipora capricornis]|uniref:microfibril-associated glycoprotein 4-like n=1 Tax=Montipora capricornis TaxID=246305 RepID=UPI0035F14969
MQICERELDVHLQKCKDALWKRWSSEYLRSLRERRNLKQSGKPCTLVVGDVAIPKSEETKRDDCRELAFTSFFFFAHKLLVKHNITTIQVHDLEECKRRCYQYPNCVSVNIHIHKNDEGLYRCELNNATHLRHGPEFLDAVDYFYHGADSACDKVGRCDNGGVCQSGYTDKGYRCVCPPGWKFAHCQQVKRNCAELYKSGERISGVYTIDPDGSGAFDVFCDQTTAGGGWTVFQKRLDGSVDFYRGWSDYKQGFGNLNGEFWLGLDKIHRLTRLVRNSLRVDLEDTAGKTAYAAYDMFAVTSGKAKYQLSLGTYSGTAGDSLSGHRGAAFSTQDSDNDSWSKNCAVSFKGAWWYTACHSSNLNGVYHHGKHSSYADGVNWHAWKGHYYSVKKAEMKIRPFAF